MRSVSIITFCLLSLSITSGYSHKRLLQRSQNVAALQVSDINLYKLSTFLNETAVYLHGTWRVIIYIWIVITDLIE